MDTERKLAQVQPTDGLASLAAPQVSNSLTEQLADDLDRGIRSTYIHAHTTESIIPPEDWSGLELSQVRTILSNLQSTPVEATESVTSTLSSEAVARIVEFYGVSVQEFSEGLSAFRNDEQQRTELALYREQVRSSVLGHSGIVPLELSESEKNFEARIAAFTNSLVQLLETTGRVLRQDPSKASVITNKEGVLTALFKDFDGNTTAIPTPFFTADNVQGWVMKPSDYILAPLVAMLRGFAHGVEFAFPSNGALGKDLVFSYTYSSPCFQPERSPNFQRIVRASDSLDVKVTAEFVSNLTRSKEERLYDLVLTFRHNAFGHNA